jgi:hypothetical protein
MQKYGVSGSHGGEYEVRVFWDLAPCSHIEVDWRFRGAHCLHHQSDDSPDDGGSTHLWNVGQLQCDYTALHPRRL